MSCQRSIRGFSLIELSIVLVVIALLAGTVLAGREMLKAQELRRIITDSRAYAVSIEQFKIKYNAVPGDMANAAELWGRADGVAGTGDCTTPYSSGSASNGKATCNGDGNGIIDSYLKGGWTSTYYEHWRAWQMMAAAGFITGKYSGIGGGCCPGVYNDPGANVPKGPRPQTGFAFTSSPAGSGWMYGDLNTYATYNIIAYGQMTDVTTPALPAVADLTPAEASSIDSKVDDSIPGLGYVQTYTSTIPNCATGTSNAAASSTYILSYASASCVLFFVPGYASGPPR